MQLNPALFTLSHAELAQHGTANLTYGSLTTKGMETLATVLRSYIPPPAIEGLDLGCGDGELIYHLAQTLEGSQWYGVELCESRVAKQSRPVFIWQGDMLEEPLHSYNVLHADNLCLEDAVAERLETKIAHEFRGIYVTYRTPTAFAFLQKAVYLDTVPTETTWTVHPVHLYEL